jgi:hypothetical protein
MPETNPNPMAYKCQKRLLKLKWERAYRNRRNGDGCIKEYQSTQGDGQLVEGTDHGVGGRRRDADTPRGSVGDEHRGETGKDDGSHEIGAQRWGEVPVDVGLRPVLEEERAQEDNRDGEQIVVEHGYAESASRNSIETTV